MTGVLNVDTIADNAGTGPVTLTKADTIKFWIYYEPDNSNNVRGSFNASSLTDNNTGDRTHNFTTNMADDDYCSLVSGQENRCAGIGFGYNDNASSTGFVRTFTSLTSNFNGVDGEGEYATTIGDLA